MNATGRQKRFFTLQLVWLDIDKEMLQTISSYTHRLLADGLIANKFVLTV